MERDEPAARPRDTMITGFGSRTFPLLGEVGEADMLSVDPVAADADLVRTSVLTLCFCWAEVADRAAASEWLRRAIPVLGLEALIDFNDVALASRALLAEAADLLQSTWALVCESDATTRGNVALEGWLRLVLGRWGQSTLGLRSVLAERARRAATGAVHADSFLVRALGVALGRWDDAELERALERLGADEDVECDVALELGMAHLRRAVQAAEPSAAVEHLSRARELFDRANTEGARPDAVAFLTACDAVAQFLAGGTVRQEQVEAVQAAAAEWNSGYLGLPRHWRQARAETAGHWALLVEDLRRVRDLHNDSWLNPMRLLADVGRIYLSYNSCELVTDFSVEAGDEQVSATKRTAPDGVVRASAPLDAPLALGPALDAGLVASVNARELVDRWLAAGIAELRAAEADEAVVGAIAAARERALASPPRLLGKGSASRDEWLPAPFREALLCTTAGSRAYDDVVQALEPVASVFVGAWSEAENARLVGALTLAEDAVLRRLLTELQALQPGAFDRWQLHLAGLLSTLLRVASFSIDQGQSGDRTMPWHSQVATARKPPEHLLADELARLLRFQGLVTATEVRDVAGGRCDLLVVVSNEQFVIEVKRVSGARWTDDRLGEDFGTQAAQYQMTGPPFAFLAVLDATRRQSRIDLTTTFWTRPWTDERLGPSAPWGLVGMRVLADVVPPSDARPR